MIASISGEISEITNDSLVLVIGGIGLKVFVPSPVRNRVRSGERLSLNTYLVVREDALSLYGFNTTEEIIKVKKLVRCMGILIRQTESE